MAVVGGDRSRPRNLKRNRAAMERQLADAKQAITRIVKKVAQGIIEDDDAAAILPGLPETRNKLAANLLRAIPTASHSLIFRLCKW
ncbi:hypothetical protein JZX86_10090 [Agrobacterium rosae]|uniref:hypothetical protein n=1 Tax=Agrobacterium rosae TaxID=1972867 RepID=UPI0019D33195|nr:hypothetical protein [Agrobacterium rosae]MBN7805711.1 hypothetical protein [Agrobacterium rosae]